MIPDFFLVSGNPRPKLRVGLLLDSDVQPAWIARQLEAICASDFAQVACVVYNAAASGPEPPARTRLSGPIAILRNPRSRSHVLYSLYCKLDRRFFPVAPELDPHRLVNCSPWLGGAAVIRVQPLVKGFVHRFPEEDLERLRAQNLDVLLRFGFNILRGGVLTVARYGIWSFHHGDNDYFRGGPPHFWELVENFPLSGVLLQRLSEDLDAGLVLSKALLPTVQGLSLRRNRFAPYWAGSIFILRKLHELHERGWEFICGKSIPNRFVEGRKKLYRTPTNWEMVRFLAPRLLRKAVMRPFRRPLIPHWKLAVRVGAPTPLSPETADLAGFRWVDSPRGHFYADPFVIVERGKRWVFFEDFLYRERRGVISFAEVLPDGRLSAAERAVEENHHLSFPFLFRHEGEIFMIPESRRDGGISLYRATAFPREWKKEKVLLECLPALDTTILHLDGFFWLFTTIRPEPGEPSELWLYYADSLFGEWTYHPANPICADARRARNAGAIFASQNRYIRPSQDCSVRYGYAIGLNEITRLNTNEYTEATRTVILPSWAKGCEGTHTYNCCQDIEVIDGNFPCPCAVAL